MGKQQKAALPGQPLKRLKFPLLDDQHRAKLSDSINKIRSKAARKIDAEYKSAVADMKTEANIENLKADVEMYGGVIADMQQEHKHEMADMQRKYISMKKGLEAEVAHRQKKSDLWDAHSRKHREHMQALWDDIPK
jgi:hypothetical protein